MVKNLGAFDRGARLGVAALLIFSGLTTSIQGWMEILFYLTAAYLAITAIVGHCLLYRALDINSKAHAGEYHTGPIE